MQNKKNNLKKSPNIIKINILQIESIFDYVAVHRI